VINEFSHRAYRCGNDCYCMYDTRLKDQCMVDGAGVLKSYGFRVETQAKWLVIMLSIILAMRLMGWAVMMWKK